jgi:arylsulfatase A-like enzyme
MVAVGVAALAGGFIASEASARQSQKPNILLILIDDMGYRDTGFTGSDYYETPLIDSLSRGSMIFDNAYACAGTSAPSRACLISGQYTPRHGIFAVTSTARGPKEDMKLEPYPNNQDLATGVYTLAEAMKDAGYRTGMVGKWHLGRTEQYYPDKQGFDLGYVDFIPTKEDFGRDNDPKNLFKEVDLMCDFMEKATKDDVPFFAYLPFHAVHQMWQAREEYVNYFEAKTKGVHDRAVFAGLIRHVDDAVGMLTGKIRSLGISDNTLIVFVSDNGGLPESSQKPLRGFKGCMYEGGLRVPMFVHFPGVIAAGSRCDVPVQNVDFFPTFIDFAGFRVPKDKILDGESLKPILTGKSGKLDRQSIFWHFPGYLDRPCEGGRDDVFRQRPSTVMRKGDWKISLFYEEWLLDGGMANIDKNNAVELYNLKEDPSEKRNLAGKERSKDPIQAARIANAKNTVIKPVKLVPAS